MKPKPKKNKSKLPKVVINAPEDELEDRSVSSKSDISGASSFDPSPIPIIREEGGSINEAFIMDSEGDEEEEEEVPTKDHSNAEDNTVEMLI